MLVQAVSASAEARKGTRTGLFGTDLRWNICLLKRRIKVHTSSLDRPSMRVSASAFASSSHPRSLSLGSLFLRCATPLSSGSVLASSWLAVGGLVSCSSIGLLACCSSAMMGLWAALASSSSRAGSTRGCVDIFDSVLYVLLLASGSRSKIPMFLQNVRERWIAESTTTIIFGRYARSVHVTTRGTTRNSDAREYCLVAEYEVKPSVTSRTREAGNGPLRTALKSFVV